MIQNFLPRMKSFSEQKLSIENKLSKVTPM